MASSSSTGRLLGKKCIVTAAAQGIGRATVNAFVREGASLVVAIDVNKDKLQELANLPGVVVKHLDVRDGAGIRALAKEITDIDVLFNCAGFVHQGDILSTSEEQWDHSFDVNVKSMFHFIQAYLPRMQERRCGSIINMSSVASSIRGIEQRALYGATKAAIIGLTKGVARDCVDKGVRCNVICPAPVATESFKNRSADEADSDKDHIDYIEGKLMGRLAMPEEVANLCVYLASDDSTYHTGNVFTIDGGFCL